MNPCVQYPRACRIVLSHFSSRLVKELKRSASPKPGSLGPVHCSHSTYKQLQQYRLHRGLSFHVGAAVVLFVIECCASVCTTPLRYLALARIAESACELAERSVPE